MLKNKNLDYDTIQMNWIMIQDDDDQGVPGGE